MYSCSSELLHSSTCTCAWAKFKSPPGEKPPVPAEFKFVRGESTGSRTVSWILCCSSVSGVFALTESSSISDSTFMLRDRENHVRIHKTICRTDTDYSALRALTAGVVLESYLLCDSLDSGRASKNTRLCGACLEGENSWLQVVATAVGAACLKRVVQDSPEFAALMSNRLFVKSLTTIHDMKLSHSSAQFWTQMLKFRLTPCCCMQSPVRTFEYCSCESLKI